MFADSLPDWLLSPDDHRSYDPAFHGGPRQNGPYGRDEGRISPAPVLEKRDIRPLGCIANGSHDHLAAPNVLRQQLFLYMASAFSPYPTYVNLILSIQNSMTTTRHCSTFVHARSIISCTGCHKSWDPLRLVPLSSIRQSSGAEAERLQAGSSS